ncbi:hypothetical protein RR46_07513 [Papilio xuthus]|uniref:Uncharacterized protein n=1 Tax=Papilio xuthus TaxID=66420 RepID=A0A194Q5P4_PAPXU|nr:hypothetical protein RR46_07513 [Papilio xuthus]
MKQSPLASAARIRICLRKNACKRANELREHRGDRHPWTSATPEELQMRCRFLKKWNFVTW